MAEASRRVVGLNKKPESGAKLDGSLVLSEANAERIVKTLCEVRLILLFSVNQFTKF